MVPVLQPLEQTVGALGLLRGALDDTADQEELRIVAAVQFGMDSFHSNTPWSRALWAVPQMSKSLQRRDASKKNAAPAATFCVQSRPLVSSAASALEAVLAALLVGAE